MDQITQNTILVTGATGNVGRNVVSQLADRGVRIRAVTRNPQAADLPDSVEVVRADLSEPCTLNGALEGVDSVFLMGLAFAPQVVPLLDMLAKNARRIVFLSSSAIQDGLSVQTNPIGKIHFEVEEEIRKTGLEWTFLRPGSFATNAVTWWAPQLRVGDVLRWPYGSAAWAPIHEQDIAAVAVRALTENGHGGKKYLLTGGELLTQIEQLRIIGEATSRTLRYEELSRDAAKQQLSASMPPFVIDYLLEQWAGMIEKPAPTTQTVEEITGMPPRTFHQWALDHTKDFQSGK